ncbi:NUDIX hydrolase, partial [Gemmatimonadota bacterium]
AICYRRVPSGVEFCFIRSSSGRRIFPKGKVEEDERPWDSAAREAKEEAGVLGTVAQQPLTTFWYDRPKRGTHELVTAYLLEVVVSEVRSEKGRKPKWWDLERALQKLSKKKQADNADELKRVLEEAFQAIAGTDG